MKHKITVYDYCNRRYGGDEPVKTQEEVHKWENVDAYCAGGDEGVFAIFFIPGTSTIGLASGDDGSWRLQQVYHKNWLEKITQATLEAFTSQESGK